MLTTIKGYYENGHAILNEASPVKAKTEVFVIFLMEGAQPVLPQRIPGALKGKVSLSEDFNEPLEDLKEYM